jgi:type IV pilus assembly protein PilE
MKKAKGFTLLELMIVVVIIAIIAAFAMFNYAKYGYRSRRVDGKEMLSRIAAAEERYYSSFNKYTNTITDLGYNASNPCGAAGCSEKGYYLISSVNGLTGDNQSYQLTAAPRGAQASDACGSLGLDYKNTRTPLPGTGDSNGPCW